MPTYCYSDKKRERTVEEVFRMGKAPRRITRDGRRLFRDVAAEHRDRKLSSSWPIWSNALAVPPNQIKATQAELAKAGIRADFNSEGLMKIENNGHRNKVLGFYGMGDNDAGYGQRAPVQRKGD